MANAIQDPVELKFCDLCGISIPQKEVDSGTTRSINGRTVGACCLSKLLADVGAATAGKPTGAEKAEGAPSSVGGLGLLLMTAVLLLGVLGAAYFLDARAAARDPATELRQLEGRLQTFQDRVDGIERIVKSQGEGVVRDVAARFAPKFDRVEKQFSTLREAMPRKDLGLDATKARIKRFGDQIADLATRQGAIESQLSKSLASVRLELSNVDQSLNDLRRKSRVADATPKRNSGSSRPKIATLPENLGKLVDKLDDEDPGVRWSAVDELVRSGDKRVVPYLLPMLKDADPFVRRLCAEGLAQIGDVNSCKDLIDALADKEAIVRESAYKSLVKLSGQRIAFDPEASESARRSMVKKWRQWWDSRSKG